MNYGIGNVKGKISGGTPTITIDVSQMIDQTTAQLTNEQYEIIENNGFINVVLPNSQSCGFNRFIDAYGDYHLAMCSGGASEITYFSVSINSTTKIATISIGDFSGGGSQLYQHNIYVRDNLFHLTIKIINDNNTMFTSQSLLQWLKDNNFNTNTRPFECSGFYSNGSSDRGSIYGVFEQNTVSDVLGWNFVYWNGSTFAALDNSWYYSHIQDINDTVIPL